MLTTDAAYHFDRRNKGVPQEGDAEAVTPLQQSKRAGRCTMRTT
jgi:hypothetical protein